MMFKGKKIFNASFDIFADNYHSVRPGYPTQLFKDVKENCWLNKNSRLLEIGAGSGIATVELAKSGSQIVAIEPGSNLVSIAKKQTKEFKNVEIFEGTFEDFQPKDKFDAVLAFTSFHWLSEGNKYQQALNLLKNSGNLVLVWNSFFLSDSQVTAEVNKAYTRFLPEEYPNESTIAEVNKGVLSKLSGREQEVTTNPLFYTIFARKYAISYNYDDQTYPKLLNTFPKIIEIEEKKRSNFFKQISEIVKKYGKISVPVLTTMIICQRRDYFLEAIANSKGGL